MTKSDKEATRNRTQLHNRRLAFTTNYRHAPIGRPGIARPTDRKEVGVRKRSIGISVRR